MKILVTGGTGFLGSHLLEMLQLTSHEILATGRKPKNLIKGVNYSFFDLRDFDETDRVIGEYEPDVVMHLAANSAESTGEHSPIEMTTSGYNTFFNVITAAIKTGKLKKFIYVSSAAVYGNLDTPYYEEQRPEPNDIYAVTKYANELSLQILAKTYSFDYVILRPHNITGERQDYTDPSRNVVPMFMQLLRLGRSPKIYGDGSSVRCYTYVKDVAQALLQSIDVQNKIINVGADKASSIKELYDTIVKISGIQVDPEYLPPRRQEVDINTVDHAHARQIFHPYTETSFEETIQRTWDWLSKQPLEEFKIKKKEINL